MTGMPSYLNTGDFVNDGNALLCLPVADTVIRYRLSIDAAGRNFL